MALNPIETSVDSAMENKAYFDKAADLLGIPANKTGNVGLENLLEENLTKEEKSGRNILFGIISSVGESSGNTGEEKGIWDAALGTVLRGGVCDNYSSSICYSAANEGRNVQTLQKLGHSTAIVDGYEIDPHGNLVYRNNRRVGEGGHRITWDMPRVKREQLFNEYSAEIRKLVEDKKEELSDDNKSDLEAFQNLPKSYRAQINSFLKNKSAANVAFRPINRRFRERTEANEELEKAFNDALAAKNRFKDSNFFRQ